MTVSTPKPLKRDEVDEMIKGYNQEKLILAESLTTPRFDSNSGRATRSSIHTRLREIDEILNKLLGGTK